MLTVIVLVCSLVTVPDRRDCAIGNDVRHETLGTTDSIFACRMAGMIAAAQGRELKPHEYPKVLCVRTDLPDRRKAG